MAKRKLTAYQRFMKTHMKRGFNMKQVSKMWKAKKAGKKISGMYKTKKRKTVKRKTKTVARRRTMAKRRKSSRRRSSPMSSYSKSNIALGTILGQVVPKFAPGASSFLPLAGLVPKAPTAVKVMSWMIASKVISDRYIGSNN